MAKQLSSQDMGSYGLIVSMVNVLILVIGLDFNTFTQRELTRKVSFSFVLKNHSALSILIYLVMIPVIYVLTDFEMIPSEYVLLFTVILFLEHIAQELFRVLIYYEKQLFVSCLLFLRTGLWSIIYVSIAYLDSSFNQLKYVLWAWLIGTSLSIIVPIVRYKNYQYEPSKLDHKWIFKGVKKSFVLMLSGICFKALFVIDRFSLNYIADIQQVGVYVFYMGVAMGIISFLEPMIFSYTYQKLLKTYGLNHIKEYREILKGFVKSTIVVSCLLIICANLLFPYVVDYTGNVDYIGSVNYFYLISVTMFFYSLSLMCHYILYSLNLDKLILISHSSSFVVYILAFIIAEFLVGPYYAYVFEPLTVVTLSSLSSFMWMFFSSLFFIYKKRKLFMS